MPAGTATVTPSEDACGKKRGAEAEKKPRAPGWEPRPEEDGNAEGDQNQAADHATAAPPLEPGLARPVRSGKRPLTSARLP
jgi:hypothetical protein